MEDKDYYKNMVAQVVKKNFADAPTFEDLFVDRSILFGDFLGGSAEPKEERVYQEVANVEKMVLLMEEYLEEYNADSTNAMSLVFFMGHDRDAHRAHLAAAARERTLVGWAAPGSRA